MAPSGGQGRGRGRGQGRRRGGNGEEGEASPEWLPPQQRRVLEASRSARTPPTGEAPGQQPRVLRSRIPIFTRRQGQSQEFLQQPDLRAAAGLDEGEARGRIAMVFRRQQGDVWAPGSPVGQSHEVDIEGVQVDLIREDDDEEHPQA